MASPVFKLLSAEMDGLFIDANNSKVRGMRRNAYCSWLYGGHCVANRETPIVRKQNNSTELFN